MIPSFVHFSDKKQPESPLIINLETVEKHNTGITKKQCYNKVKPKIQFRKTYNY